jgi:hypothetical protein
MDREVRALRDSFVTSNYSKVSMVFPVLDFLN